MGNAMKLLKLFPALTLTFSLTACSVMPWNYESTSKELLTKISVELAPSYKLVGLEKGCGLGIDCNDPNYHAVFSREMSDQDSNIECLQIIDYAAGLGLTTWYDPENLSDKFSIQDKRNEALQTCLDNLASISPFEENSGFAEADSQSITFTGQVNEEGKAAAPLELNFRISRQREEGETGNGVSDYVLLATTLFGEDQH
jgi:hypothetical protein